MLILRNAAAGQTRFDQFRTSLGIAPNILSRRLRALTEAGMLEKRRYCERPPRDEYVLSEAGRDFLPLLFAIGEWGRRHHGGAPLSRLVDARTGEDITAVVIDERTGERFGDRPIRVARPRADIMGDDKDRTDEAPEPTEDVGLPTPPSPGRLPPPHLPPPPLDDAPADKQPPGGQP